MSRAARAERPLPSPPEPKALPGVDGAVEKLQNALMESRLLSMLAAEDAYQARRSLAHFFRWSWSILEPGRVMQDGWHIDVMAEHLEAVAFGELRHLIINIPYRTSKSLLVSAAYPVWTWLQKQQPGLITCGPQTRFLTLSNAFDLAVRDAVRSRSMLQDKGFREAFPDAPKLTADQNRKDWYANVNTGYRLSMGFDSTSTGRDGDVMVIDDPHDAKKVMFSDAQRQQDLDNWDQKLGNRLTSMTQGAQIICMQRLHPQDLSGHVMEKEPGKWTHVMLPMEYEPARHCKTRWFLDPRTVEGELLCPERFPPEVVVSEKKRLGTNGYLAQLQQRPVPAGGTLIQLEWFRERYGYDPMTRTKGRHALTTVQFWDTAQKGEIVNAFWVCGTWAQEPDGRLILLDVYRKQMGYPEGKRTVVNMRNKWQPSAVVVEDKSTGSSLIQELAGLMPFEPELDKATRLGVESPAIEAGMVVLPADDNMHCRWVADYLAELIVAPSGPYMDQADMTSMALRWFRERQAIPHVSPGGDFRESPWSMQSAY